MYIYIQAFKKSYQWLLMQFWFVTFSPAQSFKKFWVFFSIPHRRRKREGRSEIPTHPPTFFAKLDLTIRHIASPPPPSPTSFVANIIVHKYTLKRLKIWSNRYTTSPHPPPPRIRISGIRFCKDFWGLV